MREAGIALVVAIGIVSTIGVGGLVSASPALTALLIVALIAALSLATWRRPRTV